MAVRTPLYMAPPVGIEPYKQLSPYNATMTLQLRELAGYAFSTNPNPRIEINGTNGNPVSGQPFTDTWQSSGAYTTRVDRFSTAGETPNIFQVTDNYSRIRVVYAAATLPTGDTNNTQYPLYLYDPVGSGNDADFQLRAMSVTDFIDTFVLPVLDQFGGGGSTLAKGGTYYFTTSPSPANATLASATPAAINNEANVAGYSASAIPTVNNITTNYYVAKVNYSPTTSGLYDNPIYDLPLYFDAGTESIKHHSPASWAALLSPFLRFYLGGGSSQHTISYNVDGADGVTAGSIFTDTRIVSPGSTFNTRYVNTNDYRTQEFPTGTATVISQKRFKIHQGPLSTLVAFASGPYSVYAVSSGLSGSCAAQFNVGSDGICDATGTFGNPGTSSGLPDTWLIAGAAADYEVRFTYTQTLNGGGTVTSAGNGVWLNCGTQRSWIVSDSSNDLGNNDILGTLQIRDVATQTIQASTSVTISADQEP